jgi:hypothetical protein
VTRLDHSKHRAVHALSLSAIELRQLPGTQNCPLYDENRLHNVCSYRGRHCHRWECMLSAAALASVRARVGATRNGDSLPLQTMDQKSINMMKVAIYKQINMQAELRLCIHYCKPAQNEFDARPTQQQAQINRGGNRVFRRTSADTAVA